MGEKREVADIIISFLALGIGILAFYGVPLYFAKYFEPSLKHLALTMLCSLVGMGICFCLFYLVNRLCGKGNS